MGAKQCKLFSGRGVNILEDSPVEGHGAKNETAAKEEVGNVSIVGTTENAAHAVIEEQGAKNEDGLKEEVAIVESEKDGKDNDIQAEVEEQGAKNEVDAKEPVASIDREKETVDSNTHAEVEEQGACNEVDAKGTVAETDGEKDTTASGHAEVEEQGAKDATRSKQEVDKIEEVDKQGAKEEFKEEMANVQAEKNIIDDDAVDRQQEIHEIVETVVVTQAGTSEELKTDGMDNGKTSAAIGKPSEAGEEEKAASKKNKQRKRRR